MMRLLICLVSAALLCGQQKAAVDSGVNGLIQVKRVYVAELVGGPSADSLRDLIIASIDAQKLFVMTDNPDRADAVLKGAADDKAFEDTFDTAQGVNSHADQSGRSTSGTSKAARLIGGSGVSDNESHHIRERKHEAYAAVRLCNREGDVLWSTTQESLGAKFRGASADVAAKIARQLALDVERASRAPGAAGNP